MKLSIALSAFLMAASSVIPSLASDDFGVVAYSKDPELLRFGDCDKYDSLIGNAMNEAVIEGLPEVFGQDEHHGRQLNDWCNYWCEGFGYGTCHWYVCQITLSRWFFDHFVCFHFTKTPCFFSLTRAWPWCYPMRRNLRGEESEGRGQQFFEEFNSIECAHALLAVESKLQALASIVDDETCASYLRDGHSFKCLRIKEE